MKKIDKLIEKTESLYDKASMAAKEIAAEAQKYVDWTDDISCIYQSSDGLVICSDIGAIGMVVPVEAFFKFAFENGRVSEDDFMSMAI